MNNMTVIGQYIPGNSLIHKLDPRIKIFSMLLLIVAVFIVPLNSSIYALITMGVMVLIPIVLIIMAKIPLLKVLSGMRPMIILLIFTFIMQIFMINTGQPLTPEITMFISWSSILAIIAAIVLYFLVKRFIRFKLLLFLTLIVVVFLLQWLLPYWPLFDYQFTIYEDGLIRSGLLVARIISVMMIASILTFTTTTIELNDGIESLLKPFKIVGLNPATWAMTMALTFRFIPTLLTETQKIMKAQTSRGVDFNESRLTQKIVQIIALLIPIFNISFKRALELADAMEVRGYVIGAKRTKIDIYKIRFKDLLGLIFSMIVLAGVIYVRIAL